MITEKDLQIENISYTNKDFAQIYPELVDLVKKLTNKWDPELTNESDVGLVLLKLNAFIGDKTNYNVDKNILEQFVTSVTQENNARKDYEKVGYNLRYYRSATATVTFKYLGGNESIDNFFSADSNATVNFKAFDTTFKTEDNIVYTLLEDINISKNTKQALNKKVIQGQLTCLSKSDLADNENYKIQLYNLDDNNRIYFPDKYVAENGIFINKIYSDISDDYWVRVDNLNDIDSGTKCYKFGFDSDKNLPYIEFPDDISNLIGDGLEVWYIITDGLSGYAKKGSITQLESQVVEFNNSDYTFSGEIKSEMYSLTNSESIGAEDPETLDEAYKHFKKTIGTFNTLVSRRDYANAIYNLISTDNKHQVSAVQVGDKRTDPNVSIPVLVRDTDGVSYYESYVKDANVASNEIIVHGTKPVYSPITSNTLYNNTYNVLSNSDLRSIDGLLDENKTIVHELVLPSINHIHHIENQYTLKVNITTNYKVNDYEQAEIIKNVKNAVYDKFNARQLDFGEEIPYEEIVETIENADTRIKYVFVEEPEIKPYLTYITTSNEVKTELFDVTTSSASTYSTSLGIITDNILAGRTSLYDFANEGFNFDYSQSNTQEIKEVEQIEADLNISQNTLRVLQENESIQILEDSFIPVPKGTYPYMVYYNFECSASTTIQPNQTYKLVQNDKLYIYYTDENDKKQFITYTASTNYNLIRPNFELKSTASEGAGENKTASRYGDFTNKKLVDEGTAGAIPLYAIGSEEQIEIVKRNETVLSDSKQQIFYYIKPEKFYNPNSYLKFDSNGYYILEEGEFFIYPNDDMTSLCVLSSGTKLHYKANGVIQPSQEDEDVYISYDELNEAIEADDLNNFEKSFKWQTIDFSSDNLTLIETSITTFVTGDSILVENTTLDRTWKSTVRLTDFDTNKSYYNDGINNMVARSVLDIVGSKTKPQTIQQGQVISVIYKDDSVPQGWAASVLSTSGTSIQINPAIDSYKYAFLGSPVTTQDSNGITIKSGEYKYPYSIYSYQTASTTTSASGIYHYIKDAPRNSRNEYVYTPSTTISTFIPQKDNCKVTIFESTGSDTLISHIYNVSSSIVNVTLSQGTMYYISTPRELEFNSEIVDNYGSSFAQTLENTLSGFNYDYFGTTNKSKLITSYDIFGPGWLIDKNNLYSDYTIGKIDFQNSEFRIVGASKK